MTTAQFTPIAAAIGGVVAAVVFAFGGSDEFAAGAGVATAGAVLSAYNYLRNRGGSQ